MGLKILKVLNTIKEADGLIKEKEDFKTRVKNAVDKLRGAVIFFTEHKETAEKLIEKLKGL